jgi:hypothetical protein
MDESGISMSERVMVVVGVMVEADKQSGLIEEEIKSVIRPHLKQENLENFIVHASHIYSGKKTLPDELRGNRYACNAILDGMVAIPAKLGLRLITSHIWWDRFADYQPGMDQLKRRVAMQATGIALISSAFDGLLTRSFPNESGWIIAERNDEVKAAALLHHRELRSSQAGYYGQMVGTFRGPYARLRDGISFANKEDAPALQIADVCAWAIRGQAAIGDARSLRFYKPLEKQILIETGSIMDATKKLPHKTFSVSMGFPFGGST